MRRTVPLVGVLAFTTAVLVAARETPGDFVIGSADDPVVAKWEDDIARFEQLDAETDDPADAIFFLGSSSIRRWDDITSDMAPWPVVRRGYGGASYLDVHHYAPRLMAAHRPRAVVLFAGNDIKGDPRDRTPEEVADLCQRLVPLVRAGDPQRPVLFVEVTPTPERMHLWPQLKMANDLVKALCERTEGVHWIATRDIYLVDGEPVPTLFGPDNLHQNAAGYAAWSARIKRELGRHLGEPRPSEPSSQPNTPKSEPAAAMR